LGNAKKGLLPWKRGVDLKVQLGMLLREDIRDIRARNDDTETHTLSVLARTRNADGSFLDEERVISETYGLMIGGHETSAATAAWLMIWLQQKPHVWRKMRDEQLSTIASRGLLDPLLQSELPYLTACLNESQRITPSAPGYVRWLKEDTQIGKWLIPGGTAVLPNIYATHRRKDIYGEDALEFKPERWLDGKGGNKSFAPHEFMPFGGGRRACIGMSHAKQQLRVIFGELARRVDFSSPFDGTTGLPRSKLLGGQVEPLEGVPLTVTAVRPASYGCESRVEAPQVAAQVA
jgi:cytochrome P450